MSKIYSRRLLTLGLVCIAVSTAQAQPQLGNSIHENMPYSRYGLGELRNASNTVLRGMGSASAAYNNRYAVNVDNPASYSFLKLTTYEAGGEGGLRKINTGNEKVSTGSATLSYLNIGFPIAKKAGIAFGLRPVSRVYYNLADTLQAPGIGLAKSSYTGEGGLNYAFLGAAWQFKGLSIGVNGGYEFGTLRHSSNLESIKQDSVKSLSSEFTRYDKIGGLYWKAGLQYFKLINDNIYINLGATIGISQHLNVTRDNYTVAYQFQDGVRVNDTAYRSDEERGEIKLPTTYSFGAQVGGKNWAVLADVQMSNWNDYRYFDMPDSNASGKAMRISGGAEFTPSLVGIGVGYFQRATYRVGGFYGKDYLRLKNTDLPYYGFTAGASLPFRRGFDRIHAAFEIGRRGTTTNNLLRETFYKFSLGVSLNDLWFQKAKYD